MPGTKESVRFAGADRRLILVSMGIVAAFSVLSWQFWQLQVVDSHTFEEMAEANMVREMMLKAPRGNILATDGTVLADSRPSSDVMFVPGDCPEEQWDEVCQKLHQFLGISAEDLMGQVESAKKKRVPFTQILVKSDVSKTDRYRLEELAFALPGVLTVVHPQRRYPNGQVAGQILGYMNEISEAELKKAEEEEWTGNYRLGDQIGRMGIESIYERDLRGEDGFMLATKYAEGFPQFRTNRLGVPTLAPHDSVGHELELEQAKNPVAGSDLILTLDLGLQKHCEEMLGPEVGAIVVLEAETGAVRALASTPTFDPTVFISGRPEERAALQKNKEEMLNRAYRELYPPGSVFKVMMAAAALEEGVITETTTFSCNGYFRMPGVNRPWRCWRHKYGGHGGVNVVDALAFSCDVFFYNLGLKLGPDRMAKWSHLMGLGRRTGIDLPMEAAGLIPTKEWKAQYNKNRPVWDQRWTDGDTVNESIGQGAVTVTPLQCAVLMSSILNGGRGVRPYLMRERGQEVSEPFLSAKTLDIITRGMRKCVEQKSSPSGTGKEAHIEGYEILGKTGTAQVVSMSAYDQYKNEEDIPRELRDHAWFIAGVANKSPKISVCVLVEHGLHGSSTAAPYAKEVIQYFYTRQGIEGPLEEVPIQVAQANN